MPAKFPNLLVNGAGGIAVGMATNIPPHNLGEVIDACLAHLENPEISIDELCQIIQGPDFPTGGLIIGRSGILSAYHKGRGSILMRARVEVEPVRKDREALIVTAIPYQINKKTLIEKIADLVRDKRVEGIADIWDETNREGMRIVIELKRDAVADVVLEPALPLLRPADDVRRQHAGDQRRPPGEPQSQGHGRGLHPLPRGGGQPAHQVPAQQGTRPGARVGRPRHCRRQHRRGDQAHPPRAEPGGGARAVDGAQLAGARHRPAHRADRRSAPQGAARRHLQAVRGAGQGHPRVAPCPPHRAGPRRDRRRAEEDRRGDQGIPRHPRLAPARRRDRQGRADGHPRRVRDAAQDRNPRDGGRGRGRGPHPARGLRRHRLAQGLHQARAAGDVSRAAPRRQGPLGCRHARRGRHHHAVRRLDAHAGAVLLLARHVLPHEGVAPAGVDADGGRQGAGQPAAAGAGRGHHLHPAAAGGRRDVGRAAARLRHALGQGAPQRAVRLREHQPQRQDRHEARRRRSASSPCASARRPTTCC